MRKMRKKRKQHTPTAAFVIVAAIVVTAACSGGMLAKYRTEQVRQAEMISAGFHISSDYLEEVAADGTAKTYTYPGAEEFQIELYNYEKENVRLTSQVDIAYDVEIKYYSDTAQKNPITNSTMTKLEQILVKDKTTPNSITVPFEPEAKSIQVTVTTTSPFTKTLTGIFQLSDNADMTVDVDRITDNGDYYLVKLHTGQKEGPLTLRWPESLLPDNTNDIMKDWRTGNSNSGTMTAKPYSTYELIFFNPNGANLTEENFGLS